MSHIQAMQEAAERVDTWRGRFGLTAQWSFGSQNLVLTAHKGHWRSKQKIPWKLFEQAREPSLPLLGCEDMLLYHFERP